MKKNSVKTFGKAGLIAVFALLFYGCAGLSNLSYQMKSGSAQYIGGATKENAALIDAGSSYLISIDGQSLPSNRSAVVGIVPGWHTIHVEQTPYSDMPPVAGRLTWDGTYGFESGKVYNIGTSFLLPAEKTGISRGDYYEWSGVRLTLTGAWSGDGPAGKWWKRD
jgi:hypothetical protein